jgi:quercetin dioxygenase-like cupin family protein
MTTAVQAYIRSGEEGLSFWFLGTLMTLKASGEQTNGAFGLIEQSLPAGFAPPRHVHHNEEEAFYLLEGEATFTCGEQSLEAGPGSFIFFPRNIPHWFRITGTGPARLLQFNFPGGLERFFMELGEPTAQSALPPAGPPDVAKLASIARKYQMEILGPAPE